MQATAKKVHVFIHCSNVGQKQVFLQKGVSGNERQTQAVQWEAAQFDL